MLALPERPEPVQELRPGREQAQVARRVLEPEPGPPRVQAERPGLAKGPHREPDPALVQAVRPGPERGPAVHREGPAHQGPVGQRTRAVQQGLLRAGRVAQVDWARAGRS